MAETIKRKKYKGEVYFSSRKDPEKAGNAFFELMAKMVKVPEDEIKKVLAGCLEKAGEAKTLRPVVKDIYALFSFLSAQERMVKRLSELWGGNTIPKEAMGNFLTGLPRGWKLIIHGQKDPAFWFSLIVPQPPFVLQDKGLKVRFKGFIVTIEGKKKHETLEIFLVVGKKPHGGPGRRPHPHCSNCSKGGGGVVGMCIGAGDQAIYQARQNWDTISLYTVFTTVLTSYSRGSAYQPLDGFASQPGFRCSSCGRWEALKKKVSSPQICPGCKAIYCKECAKKHIYKAIKPEKCELCKEKPEPKASCTKCRRGSKPIAKCNKCGKSVCVNHRSSCVHCSKVLCLSCLTRCPHCRCYFCPDYLAKEKKYAKVGICQYCVRNYKINCDTLTKRLSERKRSSNGDYTKEINR